MIKSIRFENFFCFKNTKIELEKDSNILIGINGSGKTNFLKAIKLLYAGVAGQGLKKIIFEKWGGFDNIYFISEDDKKEDKKIVLEYTFDSGLKSHFGRIIEKDVVYTITIHKIPGTFNYFISEKLKLIPIDFLIFKNGKGFVLGKLLEKDKENSRKEFEQVRYLDFDPQELALGQINDSDRFLPQVSLKKVIGEIAVYDYFDTTPFSKIRNAMLATSEKRLLPDGTNLPQILNTLKRNNKKKFRMILKKLNDVNRNYSDIDFNLIGGNIELMLEEKKLNRSIHAINISDGTLHFLCLLSIFYNPNRGQLVCIDEPETGLHPDMMLQITNAIQEFSEETQFIIATHSENILNAFNLENIRVFEKNDKNETVINQFSDKDFKGWYDKYSLGQMWRQGDLGGNRW